jgi:hypothetical protein
MREEGELFSFDRLARHAIDPVFNAIADEHKVDPNFVISVQPNYSPPRDRCLLTIKDKDAARKPLRTADLTIRQGADESVLVERSCGLVDEGKPRVVDTLRYADVTTANVERLVRDFIDQARNELKNRKA